MSDAYLGFNPVLTSNVKVGGVILFDGNGRLISKTYGLKLNTNGTAATPMAALLGFPATPILADYPCKGPTGYPIPTGGNNLLATQVGLVLYDRKTFQSQGFTDGDTGLDPAVTGYGAYGAPTSTGNGGSGEGSEEGWLDKYATPILITRYNGTIIRGE